MEIIVLGSSSSGNGYILQNANEALLIECGMPLECAQKALDWNITKLVGCLVSHRHNDHAGFLHQYAKRALPIFCNDDVKSVQDRKSKCFVKSVETKKPFKVGGFSVMALEVTHDVPCYAFVVHHKEMGTLLFATDTCGFKYNVPNLSHIMIECNYADDALEQSISEGRVHPHQRTRLLQTHLELETTKTIISRLQGDKMKKVIIIHLSNDNALQGRFTREIQAVTGLPTYAAEPNMVIQL